MVGEVDLERKAARINRDIVPTLRLPWSVGENPRVALAHLVFLFAVIPDGGSMLRMIVVQPRTEIVVNGNITLPGADSLGPSRPQVDLRQDVGAKVDSFQRVIQRIAESQDDAIVSGVDITFIFLRGRQRARSRHRFLPTVHTGMDNISISIPKKKSDCPPAKLASASTDSQLPKPTFYSFKLSPK